ncbi:cupin domain-containing protein [Jiangella asiatica]|uniref:Cupin domain-containing protein n=1 Tax=Jiangella asiatica TaxID=2530372 RepID=A0A4R5DU61_9ACTN|nr:cupin domain-containing protein [Jiangella asiatica]TDE15850.1 cupin domain-containing protein [Jiangella asiatica]
MHVGRGRRDGQPSGLRSSTTTGQVWSDIVLDAEGTRAITIFFAPGSRTRWHSHPGGQLIYTVAGEGWIQERGGELVTVGPGDVVWTEPGVEHWHGATDTGLVTQLAVHFGDVDWGDEVTEEDYPTTE